MNKINEDFGNCLQSLYPGEIVTLIEIDATRQGGQIYHIHNENIQFTQEELQQALIDGNLPEKKIIFRGDEYGGRPFGLSGIGFTSDGKAASPQLTLSNLDSRVGAMVRTYNGMMLAKVTIWILPKDLIGTTGEVEDGACRKMVFYVDRPSIVNPSIVRFDLTSPYDMDGIMIPPRVNQSVCYWAARGWYRSGRGCSYNGAAMFDKDNKPVTDPSKDRCAGTVSACKLRFGTDSQLDFGGAAAATLQNRAR